MITIAALAIFSGLSLNLLLSFALGLAGIEPEPGSGGKNAKERGIPLFQYGVLFFSVLFLWVIFTYVFPFFLGGFSEIFLFFPVSALVCMGLELLGERTFPYWIKRIFPRKNRPIRGIKKVYSAFTAYGGLVPVSLFITMNLAWNFMGAFVLALFFALGNLLAILFLNEIHRRSTLEQLPAWLRGSPLVLISMGLLSFLTISLAGIFFRILEVL